MVILGFGAKPKITTPIGETKCCTNVAFLLAAVSGDVFATMLVEAWSHSLSQSRRNEEEPEEDAEKKPWMLGARPGL